MAFTYYTDFAQDHTLLGGTLTDFAVPIDFDGTQFKTLANGGHVANANGYDIRPYTDAGLGTALDYQLETGSYDAVNGTGRLWVKQTLSASADTTMILAYGDAALTTDGSTTGTWDTNFIGVYHQGTASSLSVVDSTSNGNDGSNSGGAAAAGVIGGGLLLNSSTAYVDLSSVTLLTSGTPFTLAWWEKITADSNPFPSRFTLTVNGGGTFFVIRIQASAAYVPMTWGPESHASVIRAPSAPTTSAGTGVWMRWVITGNDPESDDPADYTAYVNKTTYTTSIAGGLGSTSSNRIGYDGADSGSDCTMDEIRVSDIERSADWLDAEYDSQNDPATFTIMGTEHPFGGGAGNWNYYSQQ